MEIGWGGGEGGEVGVIKGICEKDFWFVYVRFEVGWSHEWEMECVSIFLTRATSLYFYYHLAL